MTGPRLECPLCDWTGRDDERADARVLAHMKRDHPHVTEDQLGRAWAQREIDDLMGGRTT